MSKTTQQFEVRLDINGLKTYKNIKPTRHILYNFCYDPKTKNLDNFGKIVDVCGAIITNSWDNEILHKPLVKDLEGNELKVEGYLEVFDKGKKLYVEPDGHDSLVCGENYQDPYFYYYYESKNNKIPKDCFIGCVPVAVKTSSGLRVINISIFRGIYELVSMKQEYQIGIGLPETLTPVKLKKSIFEAIKDQIDIDKLAADPGLYNPNKYDGTNSKALKTLDARLKNVKWPTYATFDISDIV